MVQQWRIYIDKFWRRTPSPRPSFLHFHAVLGKFGKSWIRPCTWFYDSFCMVTRSRKIIGKHVIFFTRNLICKNKSIKPIFKSGLSFGDSFQHLQLCIRSSIRYERSPWQQDIGGVSSVETGSQILQ